AQKAKYATAQEMAAAQREISVAEFFAKNRHLLGFDNPAKAVLTTVREAVDNSLDACEEAGILPEITVEVSHVRRRPEAAAGKAATITSRTGKRARPSRFRVGIDLAKNAPESRDVEIDRQEEVAQGTKVVLEIEGRYQKHGKSVDEYLKETAVANPHARLVF